MYWEQDDNWLQKPLGCHAHMAGDKPLYITL